MASSSRCTALIIAPPTIDIIAGTPRPGGPALFSGHALRLHGVEPLAFYPHPPGIYTALSAERRVGVKRLGAARAECRGPVFIHEYQRGGKRKTRLLEPPCPVDPAEALSYAEHSSPDFVLLSPLYGEEPGMAAELLGHKYRVYLDLQGYARAGLEPPRAPIAAAHASSDDMSLDEAAAASRRLGWLLYTTGESGGVILYRGNQVASLPKPIDKVRDPTGAGDVFTALTAYAVECRGLDILEAARWASQSVALALKSLGDALRGAR